MNDENGKTLIRIEATLDRILASVSTMAEDSGDGRDQIDRIETLLEKLLEQSQKQTSFLERLWANDRTR